VRRRNLTVLVLATVTLIATACGTRVSAPPAAPAPSVPPAASPTASGSAVANPASDIGVTPKTITVGVLVSRTSPLGPDALSGSYYGATAYFDALNRRGGINGRMVRVVACDDTGSGPGNVACAHTLIDHDHVFALAGTTVFSYDGAGYVNQQGVPDVGGQPVGNAYDQYPHLWNLYGSDEPRDGKTIGWNGKLYGGTEVYRWFKDNLGAKKAAVVFYNVAPSQRYAQLVEESLRTEGYTVRQEQVDLGLANFDSIAVDIGAAKVDTVFDALDTTGNIRLCKALDAHKVKLKAKVTTTQGWTGTVASDYAASPVCRNTLYATGNSQNFDDRSKPGVAAFQDAVDRLYPDRAGRRSDWELEGYASAQWLTDAMNSCGAQLTRKCIENYLRTTKNYTGHGLLTPRDFVVQKLGKTKYSCLNVARWQDNANGGKAGWVSQVPDMNKNCFDVPQLAYSP
jgi:branched-chain amino acid transport system substrate-binding protein